MNKKHQPPALHTVYREYLVSQDLDAFAAQVSARYTVGTLERLTTTGDRMARRAAVLAVGRIADFSSNAVLGRALTDGDRGVRMLADNGIRLLWCRTGHDQEQSRLDGVIELICARRFQAAVEGATQLIARAPTIAEAWNQRAIALFNLGRFAQSISDCQQALEHNPYHFAAATGMGHCHLKSNDRSAALECFHRALALNPGLEGVRAHVQYLQRTLKRQE
ncbi:MAG TPA: tetratricopeptide repeat protein [Pirellulales bacterium]